MIGLMNQCARLLLSETVLLVPLLLSARQPGADSGRFGPIVEEPDWTGLQNVEFRLYREKIRACSDKRRFAFSVIFKIITKSLHLLFKRVFLKYKPTHSVSVNKYICIKNVLKININGKIVAEGSKNKIHLFLYKYLCILPTNIFLKHP